MKIARCGGPTYMSAVKTLIPHRICLGIPPKGNPFLDSWLIKGLPNNQQQPQPQQQQQIWEGESPWLSRLSTSWSREALLTVQPWFVTCNNPD
jgi:hypothetical protein